ncbi:MAG: TROVE domain-containing protein [Saprospiraceae bacterium]
MVGVRIALLLLSFKLKIPKTIMALFNKKRKFKNPLIRNRGGGLAFRQDAKLHLASLLLTSFAQDQYYRKAKQTHQELFNLLDQVDPVFAAKAAVYARKTYGMRSITHLLAARLATKASGHIWAKDFYQSIVQRPDDMLEIYAAYRALGNEKLPNAMKKGFAQAFTQFDAYQLAKYRGQERSVKLVDLVNLVHPKPTAHNQGAIGKLVNQDLKAVNTWEAKLSNAGQATTVIAKKEQKAAAWSDLIREQKIGYFALLRNLRNIAEQAPEVLDQALKTLVDRQRIKKSKVLPFRYLTAQDAILEAQVSIRNKRRIQRALNRALEISVDNVPVFDGRTLVVLDDSGSMTWVAKGRGKPPIQIGAIFAAMLYKSNDADLMRFSDRAAYVYPFFRDSIFGITDQLVKNARSAGTNFHAIFQRANKAYDRIIILSDMQGWIGTYSPKKTFEAYKRKYQADPFVYSFDLQGYGSLQLPQQKTFCLAGFSDKVFDLMALLETDPQALIHEIEAIKFVV